jgi:hypothetical protein
VLFVLSCVKIFFPNDNTTASFRNSRSSSSQNLDTNGHFAPPSSLQRSNSRGNSKLVLQKDKVIEALRLELAEAQIKVLEMENVDGGRVQELERILLETRVTNARLLEENESFQLLLKEKTLNGDFTRDFIRESSPEETTTSGSASAPGTSLADELENADDDSRDDIKRLETEVKDLKEQNKALSLYINKIIERVLQHQGFESVLDKSDLDAASSKPNTDKELPPPPPPKENAGASFLQRAKSVAMNATTRPRPRPMSYAPQAQTQPNTVNEDPATAPSIPLARSTSQRVSSGGMHRRSTSEWPAAQVVNNMYRGPSPGQTSGQISPAITSPRNSFFGRMPSSSSVPRASIDENRAAAQAALTGENEKENSSSSNVDTPSPPRSVASSFDRPGGSVMAGNKIRPLRLVQETAENDANAGAKAANRGSWIAGWFNKGQPAEGGQ